MTAGVLLKKMVGRIGLDALHVLRHDLALVDVGQHSIERNHAFVVGNGLVDGVGDLANLLLGQGLEVRLGDLHLLKAHQPFRDGDIGLGLDLDRAECRLVAGLAAIGHGAEGLHARLLVPGSRSAADRRGCCPRSAGCTSAASRRRLAWWRRRRSRAAVWRWAGPATSTTPAGQWSRAWPPAATGRPRRPSGERLVAPACSTPPRSPRRDSLVSCASSLYHPSGQCPRYPRRTLICSSRQPRSSLGDGAFDEEPDRSPPQIGAREHQRLAAPSLGPHDSNTLDRIAVLHVKG